MSVFSLLLHLAITAEDVGEFVTVAKSNYKVIIGNAERTILSENVAHYFE